MEDNDRIGVLLDEARQKIQVNDVSTALDMLLEEVGDSSYDTEIINLIAHCYYYLGEFERAQACWEKVIEIDNRDVNALSSLEEFQSPAFQFWLKRYDEGLNLVEAKNYAGAKDLFRLLLEEDDRFVRLYQLLGLCYLACGEHANAEKIWTKGLELDIHNSALANYLKGQPKKDKMVEVVKDREPENKRRSWVINRMMLLAAGVLVLVVVIQSIVMVKANQTSSKTIKDMQDKIGVLSQQTGEQQNLKPVIATPANEESQEESLVAENNTPDPELDLSKENQYYREGYLAYENKRWDEGIAKLGAVVEMDTHSYLNREALYYLARIYYVERDYEKAEEYYLKYLKDYPNSNYYDDSLYDLGCLYHYSGKDEKALATFKKLQEIQPPSIYTHYKLFKKVVNL